MTTSKRKILVTGATGQVGGELIRLLAHDDSLEVVAAARNPDKANHLGVPVVLFDYERKETFAPALEGVDSLFIVTGYTVDMLKQSYALVNAAKRAGVKYIVHLGAPGDDDTPVAHWAWHQFVERYIERSGFAFTHLRPELFMQNLLGYGGSEAEGDGVIRHYIGDAKVSWVDVKGCRGRRRRGTSEPRHPRGQDVSPRLRSDDLSGHRPGAHEGRWPELQL
jgi:NAD(P)H dehydrogenase (quinone)